MLEELLNGTGVGAVPTPEAAGTRDAEASPRDGMGAGGAERGFASEAEPAPMPSAPHHPSSSSGFVRHHIEEEAADEDDIEPKITPPPLTGPRRNQQRTRSLAPPVVEKAAELSPAQRLLILDTWQRSGLPAGDFATLVGVSKHTLYAWKKRFDEEGPGGLLDRPRGVRCGSKLPDLTKRTILMLKQSNPEWGCQRISDMLARGPALPANALELARQGMPKAPF